MKKIIIIILLLLVFSISLISNDNVLNVSSKMDNSVILGGNAVGLRLLSSGVLVVGSDRKDNKFHIADVILEVNNVKIESNDDLIKEINKYNGDEITLKVLRNYKIIDIKLKPLKEDDEYRLGLWVKDSSAGLGTITFISNGKFASLGHPVTETKENKILDITTGGITRTVIYDVVKGFRANPR